MTDEAPTILPWLDSHDPDAPFPAVTTAQEEPNGLLAAGGDLHPQRLLNAYRQGIFPWYSDDQPILWWSPDPRTILLPKDVHVSRSLKRWMRRNDYEIRFDTAFDQVVRACAADRQTVDDEESGTWITDDMRLAYGRLHQLGYAHSIELWQANELVGGLYGVAIGDAFCGESMFSVVPNASKVVMVELCRWMASRDMAFLDCQMPTDHLASMGAITISRETFMERLASATAVSDRVGRWSFTAEDIKKSG